MTNKEAIDRLSIMQGRCENGYDDDALDLAIKVLEERPTGEWIGDTDYESYQGNYEAYKCNKQKGLFVLKEIKFKYDTENDYEIEIYRLSKEILMAKGMRKQDLIRYRHKMEKELFFLSISNNNGSISDIMKRREKYGYRNKEGYPEEI